MESMDNELNELKGFIADLKAERASQKEKEKRESWTKYTSLSLVFVAVLAAIATQWAGKYSSRTLAELNNSTFNQALATDKWSEYQANSIKQNLYEAIHETAAPARAGSAAETAKADELFKSKVDKYKEGKDKTSKEAKGLEEQRDAARKTALDSARHGSGMGMATSIFQIGIAMGSICLVVKKKWLWYVSMLLAAIATVQMVLVWLQ
jgi:hypothetical protein